MAIHILNNKHGVSAQSFLKKSCSDFECKKQRRHEVWILTCYVDLKLIESFVDDLRKTIKVTDLYLAFNFAEIYNDGPTNTQQNLQEIAANLKKLGINFEWKALKTSLLVHSKGYAIVQRTNGIIADGIVLTTSANFTKAGFTGGNIEMGYSSTTKKDLKQFEKCFNYLCKELGCEIDSAVYSHGSYLLQFAILSSGLFLHKWSGSLSQRVGIKYSLTSLAKEKGSIAPELAELGFESGNTFSRQVLDLGNLPQKEVPGTFMKRFTIETYWGRWCPTDAWRVLSETFSGSEEFIARFQSATDGEKLETIKKDALEVQNRLIHQGLIEAVGEDHLDRWVENITELRSNRDRLDRFFTGYEAHRLPYSVDQDTEIDNLFENLKEAIELSKATNIAKQKVLDAIENADPNLIQLDAEEVKIIKSMQMDI